MMFYLNCWKSMEPNKNSLMLLFDHIKKIAFFEKPNRISRGEFILSTSFAWIATAAVTVIWALLWKLAWSLQLFQIVNLIAVLGSLYFYVLFAIRRGHDMWRKSSKCRLLLIPIYNLYIIYQLLAVVGQKDKNEFGEDPLKTQAESNNDYWILWWASIVVSWLLNMVSQSILR